ncbi:MAG: class II fructose-bisphosphate aldolase [Kiritimatiellia bacterium]|nr:class II fructose-bisphosphate aldolase [Kiritimatiellia bacterium]
MKRPVKDIINRAWQQGLAVPAFNIPYLPMMEPVIKALHDAGSFGLIAVARLEWIKFQAIGLKAIADEYQRLKQEKFTRLHLDHVPVIDEDHKTVDYNGTIFEAIELGYDSVMIDGSRLPFKENVAITKQVVQMAHSANVPAEAELGAVLGHESGPLPSYDELFASGRGFTDPQEAKTFVKETDVDWLSFAIGNIHGAISGAAKNAKKVEARLHIERLRQIRDAVGIPLVLHGGSGIKQSAIMDGIRNGIAKINVATAIRQPYEQTIGNGLKAAQEAVYRATLQVLNDELRVGNSAQILNPEK